MIPPSDEFKQRLQQIYNSMEQAQQIDDIILRLAYLGQFTWELMTIAQELVDDEDNND